MSEGLPPQVDAVSAHSEVVPVWRRTPRAVYVHVPFCAQRCGYCNFALIADRGDLVDAYLGALALELERRLAPYPQPLPIETLFLGGGTPTFLSPAQVDRLIALLRQWFVWDPSNAGWEWTVECNPNDLQAESVGHWAEHGVNRFSLGAQSFRAAKLTQLERTHQGDDVRRGASLVLERGARLSLDLIFGVGDESIADWEADLQAAVDCQPDHLSTYQLTYEKGTQFWNRLQRGQLHEPEQEDALQLYLHTRQFLSAAGYQHYEVSNFARPGSQSRHNRVYWTGRPYLAFGPGAASYVGGQRLVNHASTTTYIKRLRDGELAITDTDDDGDRMRAREYFVFGMRLLEGIDPSVFQRETGFELAALVGPTMARDVAAGFFVNRAGRWQLTETGLAVSDGLWPDYLSEPTEAAADDCIHYA